MKNEVLRLISENPLKFSKEIGDELNINKDELIEIYQQIRDEKNPIMPISDLGRFLIDILKNDILVDADKIKNLKEKNFTFPDEMELHLGRSCQCACVFCWRWSEGTPREVDEGLYKNKKDRPCLQMNDISKLLKEFKNNGGKTLYLSGGLEFFTSEMATDVIRFGSELGLRIRAYTNGISDIFDDVDFQHLLLNNLDYLRFSLHAFTPSSYAKVVMPHSTIDDAAKHLQNVKRRIKELVDLRGDATGKAHIRMAFLVTRDNYRELEKAVVFWNDVGIDYFFIGIDMSEQSSWFTPKEKLDLERIVNEIKERDRNGEYGQMKVFGFDRHEPRTQVRLPATCFVSYKHPTVDPWGDIYMCCYRAHPSFQRKTHMLGNFLSTGSLREILVQAHNNSSIPFTQCAQCSDWELAYNRGLEKVLNDWNWGIAPNDLPFR